MVETSDDGSSSSEDSSSGKSDSDRSDDPSTEEGLEPTQDRGRGSVKFAEQNITEFFWTKPRPKTRTKPKPTVKQQQEPSTQDH
jgi:hypothetical protein